jgi:polyisoprenoid-binding protein YceI
MVRRLKTRRGLLMLAGALVVAAVAAFAFIYFVLFPTSSSKPFSLKQPTVAVPVSSGGSLSGSWTIAPGSRAGYRVREKLAFLPAMSDAVGRTSQITGRATVSASASGVTISAASFRVAVNTLRSNESMRDQHIQTIGLQSATYPTATFVLSKALEFGSAALSGRVVRSAVTGRLEIHGTTRRVTIPVQMRFENSAILAVGSLTFAWGLFNMSAPSVGGFVSVTSHATMEFDLRLARVS